MKNGLLFVLLSLSIMTQVNARSITLDNSCYIELPDSLIEIQTPKYLYKAYNNDCSIIIRTLYVEDFDKEKVMAKMDTICFKMDGYKLIEEKHEGFWNIAEDYSYKFYEKEDGSMKCVTYTWCSVYQPYCMICDYKDEAGLAYFDRMVAGIQMPKPDGFLRQLYICWTRGKGTMCTIIVLSFLGQLFGAIFGRHNSTAIAAVMTLVIAGLLLYNIWGYWYVIAALLLWTFVFTKMTAAVSFSEFMERIG